MRTELAPFREAIVRQTTKDIVRDKIVALIASGILRVGDDLPSERELASMLSVSRETVRGAIQRLAGEQIVQISQGSRTRIVNADVTIATQRIGITNAKAITGYSLESVQEARLLVETEVVATAAQRISDQDLARLEASLKTQVDCLDDPMRFLICDREFHLTIAYSSGQQLLADLVVDLYTYMLDHARRVAMSKPGAVKRSVQEHRRIVKALRARDSEAVEREIRQHIMRGYDDTPPRNGSR